MRILCDVHISFKVVNYLVNNGIEAIHINGILDKWHTKDSKICAFADKNDYIVLTKDADFKDSFLIKNTPRKLIKVNLGNISTVKLIEVITSNIEAIQKLNATSYFMVELGTESVTFFEKPKNG